MCITTPYNAYMCVCVCGRADEPEGAGEETKRCEHKRSLPLTRTRDEILNGFADLLSKPKRLSVTIKCAGRCSTAKQREAVHVWRQDKHANASAPASVSGSNRRDSATPRSVPGPEEGRRYLLFHSAGSDAIQYHSEALSSVLLTVPRKRCGQSGLECPNLGTGQERAQGQR